MAIYDALLRILRSDDLFNKFDCLFNNLDLKTIQCNDFDRMFLINLIIKLIKLIN